MHMTYLIYYKLPTSGNSTLFLIMSSTQSNSRFLIFLTYFHPWTMIRFKIKVHYMQ